MGPVRSYKIVCVDRGTKSNFGKVGFSQPNTLENNEIAYPTRRIFQAQFRIRGQQHVRTKSPEEAAEESANESGASNPIHEAAFAAG